MKDKNLSLPVMEEFYSLQGEGYHTGEAAYFVRVAGCDVGCHFCDVKESWDASVHNPTPINDILERILQTPTRNVVVTGGEPMLYDFTEFCAALRKNNIRAFLETSGSEKLTGEWDWICVSPKRNAPVRPEFFPKADELKMIICSKEDFQWAEENSINFSKPCLLYLQPEWSVSKKMMPLIVEYILHAPKWKISLQSHKYMNIP